MQVKHHMADKKAIVQLLTDPTQVLDEVSDVQGLDINLLLILELLPAQEKWDLRPPMSKTLNNM